MQGGEDEGYNHDNYPNDDSSMPAEVICDARKERICGNDAERGRGVQRSCYGCALAPFIKS